MNALKDPRYAGIAWLIVRLWLGYEWLMGGIEKVFGGGSAAWVGDKAGAGVAGFLKGAIAKSPLAEGFDPVKTPHPQVQEWYAILARDYFLPNAAIFSYLVAYGELLVGLALILGIFTHFSALMGVIMNLAFLFAGSASTNPQMLVVGLAIVLVGGVAVGYYGLDYFARPIEKKLTDRTFGRLAPTPQLQ
ncbi:MAG TPA: DoxX family protein [Herpetosiphonaceae bacterium]